MFSAWDRLGGTFRRGDGERRVVTGLPEGGLTLARSLPASLPLPFGRQRIESLSFSGHVRTRVPGDPHNSDSNR